MLVKQAIDVGIITVIPHEITALLKMFGVNKSRIIRIGKYQECWLTEVLNNRSKKKFTVVIGFLSGESGNIESSITTNNFLRHWNPKMMCLVGIAAGIKGKVKIGDVVIPNSVLDRTIKVFDKGSYKVREKSYNRDDVLNSQIKVYLDKDELEKSLSQDQKPLLEKAIKIGRELGIQENEIGTNLAIEDGTISSDNVLIRDANYFNSIVVAHQKCRGGEMEAAGFARACELYDKDLPYIVVRGISDFGDERKDDNFHKLSSASACYVLYEMLVNVIDVPSLRENPQSKPDDADLGYSIKGQFDSALENQRWQEACNIGSAISRALWISGNYESRILIGERIQEAAFEMGNKDIQAGALIDDLGWTKFVLKQKSRAKMNIKLGIQLASQDPPNHYLLAKAYRHYGSIYRQEGDFTLAESHLETASEYCSRIKDDHNKKEIDNSLLISKGKLLERRKNYKEAIKVFLKALENFKDLRDVSREVKVYSLIGNCYKNDNKEDLAISYYKMGRAKAIRSGRFTELKNNTLPLLESDVVDPSSKEELF